jgi:peptidoglycan/xylan/chitin deacetylase (PgdA/CDA1 family)
MTHQQKINILTLALPAFRLNKIMNRLDTQILLPFWHTVSDEELPHISHLYHAKTTSEFKNDLEFLLKNFTPISAEDLLKKKLKKGKKYIHLSFDDGLKEIFSTVAPILKEKGIPASFFINPPFIDDKEWFFRYEISWILNKIETTEIEKSKAEIKKLKTEILNIPFSSKFWLEDIRNNLSISYDKMKSETRIYLTTKELKQLSNNGFHIGAHSMYHPDFSKITSEQQLAEVKDSVSWITENLNPKLSSFAFPFSDDGVSKENLKAIHNLGPLDLSFGTSGIGRDNNISHFQRIPMEHQKCYNAKRIIKSELLSSDIKRILGR